MMPQSFTHLQKRRYPGLGCAGSGTNPGNTGCEALACCYIKNLDPGEPSVLHFSLLHISKERAVNQPISLDLCQEQGNIKMCSTEGIPGSRLETWTIMSLI